MVVLCYFYEHVYEACTPAGTFWRFRHKYSPIVYARYSMYAGFYLGLIFEGEKGGRAEPMGCLSSPRGWVWDGDLPLLGGVRKLKHNFISEFSKNHLRNTSGDLIART